MSSLKIAALCLKARCDSCGGERGEKWSSGVIVMEMYQPFGTWQDRRSGSSVDNAGFLKKQTTNSKSSILEARMNEIDLTKHNPERKIIVILCHKLQLIERHSVLWNKGYIVGFQGSSVHLRSGGRLHTWLIIKVIEQNSAPQNSFSSSSVRYHMPQGAAFYF